MYAWELEGDRGVLRLFENRYSGLGANLVSAIGTGDSGETNLCVGTPSSLSCYSYYGLLKNKRAVGNWCRVNGALC
jgi:hypothetical protein